MKHPAYGYNGKRRSALWFRACLALAALALAALLGCVTTLPRPDSAATPTAIAVSPSPSVTPTQAPSPTPEPTATSTPIPTAEPTETPAPTLPPPTPTLTPVPTDAPGGLLLAVFAPEDGAVVPGSSVVVYGQTEPGVAVSINGVGVAVDAQGGFRADMPLEPGENLLEISATAEEGDSSRASRRVISLSQPFLLLITEPENESVVDNSRLPLIGRTGPNAIVSINGRSVPVDRFGYFSETMLLVEGPNFIDVVATNDDGETLSKVVRVIYRPASE